MEQNRITDDVWRGGATVVFKLGKLSHPPRSRCEVLGLSVHDLAIENALEKDGPTVHAQRKNCEHCIRFRIWGFPKLWVPSRDPNNKDYSIWGSILGSPI